MNPTDELKDEHKAIKLMIKILEKVSEKLKSGEGVDPTHLEKIVDFIKVFADKCHHAKEECLLFPAIEEAGIPREGGPIGVMLKEHKLGRGYVKEMSEAVARHIKGDHKTSLKFAKNARNYALLLKQHIDKEDNILYKMADMRISEEKQKELSEGFERIEEEVIGAGKHEEYHRLLKQLKSVYLTEKH